MKKRIFKIICALIRRLGLQNIILIEAEQSGRENTQAVFAEMLCRDWTRRYRFALISWQPETLEGLKSRRVSIYPYPARCKSTLQKWKLRLVRLRAALIIDENRQISKLNPTTIRVFLSHGSPAKSVRKYYSCKPDADYMLNLAEFWKQVNAYEFQVDESRLVTLGYPRNDDLLDPGMDVKGLFQKAFRRLVIWYPTYRQHKNAQTKADGKESPAIPVIHDEAAALAINAAAAKYETLLVVKPHPAQDLSLIKRLELDHIRFIDDDFFTGHGIRPYQFLAGTDALITDYSSVFFDYLLTGKPVGLTFEDYEQYREQVGFAIDMDLMRSCSSMLETPADFEAFFRDLSSGNDPCREKREEIKRLTNQYTDGNSARRVVDWLETLLPHGTGK